MNDWIIYADQTCPVAPDTIVAVIRRNGTSGTFVARDIRLWGDHNTWGDIVAYRVVAEKPAAPSDGWIEWKGGECPVPDGTLVDARYRDGKELSLLPANELDRRERDASSAFWRHGGHRNDIVAYRVVQEADRPSTNPGGWIEQGGERVGRTVRDDTLVEVRTADGTVGRDVAGAFDWSAVVAYRVLDDKTESRGGVSAVDTLRKAADLIEQRGKQRDGHTGERSMARTVAAFNAIYGAALTETQGWHFMELLKMSRSSQGCYVADDFDDKVAYAALAAECEASARGR